MNRIYKSFFVAMPMAFLLGCAADKSVEETFSATSVDDAKISVIERCASMKVHEEKLKENPGLAKRMEAIEAHTRKFEQSYKATNGKKPGTGGGGGTVDPPADSEPPINIPVVVNVLYSNSGENISDAQIKSQIDILNADFNATNTDFGTKTPFDNVKTSMKFTFTLKTTNRQASTKTSWGTRDAMKSSRTGGIDPTDPARNLNIWVCNIGGGILGYAQFPGGSLSTDGVVIGPQYFGNTSAAPYNKGRTATHEVGHWINLRHIWGDATCGNDYVGDTPVHNTANYGCPGAGHASTCNNLPEMTMNYMDYTDDACMFMFSVGQKARGRAVFAAGGPRNSFVTMQ